MKRLSGFALMLVLFAVPAFAGPNSKTVNLSLAVKVGSTQLPVGTYTVTWTGSGSNAQVTLAQKGKASVTVPATVVAEKHVLPSFSTSKQGGVDVLESIQLSDVNLVLGTAPTTGQ